MPSKLPPISPGEILNEEYLIPLKLSQNALARSLGVPPARINDIVKNGRAITADTALRLARFFDTTPQFWLNLQMRYELELALDANTSKINEIIPLKLAG